MIDQHQEVNDFKRQQLYHTRHDESDREMREEGYGEVYHQIRRNEEPVTEKLHKSAPFLSLIAIVFGQLVGVVWFWATLNNQVENIQQAILTGTADRYAKTQAEADNLNLQVQIDQIKKDDERDNASLKDLEERVDKLYDKVYGYHTGK